VRFERVHFFGKGVGFVLAQADAYARDGARVPGIVFIRGSAAAIMPVLITPAGVRYTVLVRQPRLPVGHPFYEEIPAGMIDDRGAVCTALDELKDEVGSDLAVEAEDLVLLETVHSSPGAIDEIVQIFYAEKAVPDALVSSLSGRMAGNPDEHESTIVDVVPLDDLAFRASSDMKSRLAYYSYMARRGIVPESARQATPSPLTYDP
jgi:hypothetical protein